MSLTPEQKQTVASWVAAGDNLSAIQKKLSEQLKISMTYMDVRFLVDDLDLALKDPAPKVDTSDVSKAQPAKPKSPSSKSPAAGANGPAVSDQDLPADLEDGELAEDPNAFPEEPIPGNVTVEVNKVNLIPGALASGTVTFSDGVTADWIVDNQGRPGFTKVSQPGYRPTPQDGQVFMQELSAALQRQGY